MKHLIIKSVLYFLTQYYKLIIFQHHHKNIQRNIQHNFKLTSGMEKLEKTQNSFVYSKGSLKEQKKTLFIHSNENKKGKSFCKLIMFVIN